MDATVTIILGFLIGYVVALTQGGIHIHHHQKEEKETTEYTESTAHLMDSDMKAYLDQNNGMRND